jgi:K+-sensing histidine kinase KdpD
LSEDEQLFLRSLALEAGLALRNARLYAREQEQVERLRRFEALQATFFSATAHELKTPLTVLKTLAPALCPLPHLPIQTQNEISQTFAQNLERLELLVTDMLESIRSSTPTGPARARCDGEYVCGVAETYLYVA